MKKLIVLLIISVSFLAFNQTPWVAPESAAKVQNPVPVNAASIKSGEKTFQSLCWTCHGKNGKGDGPVAPTLTPKPGILSSEIIQSQSDGAIFWKISEGRGVMSTYKGSLTTKQRWELVNYIRTLKQ
jgi:mono/diheme cytochrome c family protein